jgi:hypothetical protein
MAGQRSRESQVSGFERVEADRTRCVGDYALRNGGVYVQGAGLWCGVVCGVVWCVVCGVVWCVVW